LAGKILSQESRKCLFKSERRSSEDGTTIKVTCDYTYPDGTLAARDRIVYKGQQLVSYEEEEFQTGEKGVAVIRPDPKNPGKQRIYFEYSIGEGGVARKSTGTEPMESNTIVDDMLQGFMVSHWDGLQSGAPAKFRYIVLSRKETVGFELVKESEAMRDGKPVVRIKMAPSSFIIARLVDPLTFVVEKNGAHRILEYIGRVTPLVKQGTKWKDLDALTVFDWKPEVASAGTPAIR
jgi:hypothetical protein